MRTPKLSSFLMFASAVCILSLSPVQTGKCTPSSKSAAADLAVYFQQHESTGCLGSPMNTRWGILPVDTLSTFRQCCGFQLPAETQELQIDLESFWAVVRGALNGILAPFVNGWKYRAAFAVDRGCIKGGTARAGLRGRLCVWRGCIVCCDAAAP